MVTKTARARLDLAGLVRQMHVDANAPEADLGICISKQTKSHLVPSGENASARTRVRLPQRHAPLRLSRRSRGELRYHLPRKRGGCGKLSAWGVFEFPGTDRKSL